MGYVVKQEKAVIAVAEASRAAANDSGIATAKAPAGGRRRSLAWTPARAGVYAFLIVAALFFLLPLYVMLVTSVKPMEEIRLGTLFALPVHFTLEPWVQAWQSACTGLECEGIRGGCARNTAARLWPARWPTARSTRRRPGRYWRGRTGNP